MRSPPNVLSDEDRVLWTLVARTAEPLKGRKALTVPTTEKAATVSGAPIAQLASPLAASAVPKKRELRIATLDRPTFEKLSKGRLPIEGRVDLHGLTQDEAYSLLLSFLRRAHRNGVRYVLVITGKGSSAKGDGVLRRSVPAWLATPPFRALIGSHDEAAPQHGGGGALYLRLRKLATPNP